jgi:hypothetical protein
MKLSRFSRLIAMFLALVCMLTMQIGVAAHPCFGMMEGQSSPSTKMAAEMVELSQPSDKASHEGMSGCQHMDMQTQAGLCHAQDHGQEHKQSLDKPDVPHVMPFSPAGFVLEIVALDDTAQIPFPWKLPLPTRTTAPPLSIRHCCFRI